MSGCCITPSPISVGAGIDDIEDNIMTMGGEVDGSPFDEPPLSDADPSTSDMYRMDAISFYRSFYRSSTGQIDKLNSSSSDTSAPKRVGAKFFARCPSDMFAADDSSTGQESRIECSEVSSLVNHKTVDKDSMKDTDGRDRFMFGKSNAFCTTVGDFNEFFCQPPSSYTSKPIPKPVIWKGYTSLKGACLEAFEDNVAEAPFCKTDSHEQNEVQSLGTTSSTVEVQEVTSEQSFFEAQSIQDYLDLCKITAHHFLKSRIFVDDPEIRTSKDTRSDCDSVDDSTILSSVSATAE